MSGDGACRSGAAHWCGDAFGVPGISSPGNEFANVGEVAPTDRPQLGRQHRHRQCPAVGAVQVRQRIESRQALAEIAAQIPADAPFQVLGAAQQFKPESHGLLFAAAFYQLRWWHFLVRNPCPSSILLSIAEITLYINTLHVIYLANTSRSMN